MKFRVRLLVIPEISFHVIVTLWAPGVKLFGGLQFHDPPLPTFILSVIGFSDSIFIVSSALAGPSPKNSGWVEVTVSPSSTLSRVTVPQEVGAPFSGMLNFDS